MPVAYLGLGSNLGDRAGRLAAALDALEADPRLRVTGLSHVYESAPWGVLDQPAFLNAVAEVEFDGTPHELLGLAKDVERALGREDRGRWGAREIDVDVLLFGGIEVDTAELTVPHPRLLERDFVVIPLLELAPDATLPGGNPIEPPGGSEGAVLADLGELER